MTDKKSSISPVRKSVTVPLSVPRAFSLFTQDFAAWWPLTTHSVGQEHAAHVRFATKVGDQIVETSVNGTEEIWGTLLAMDVPHRIAFSWHPGRTSDAVTHVDVTFTATSDGGTVVELSHSGWERWQDGEVQAANYANGWTPVIAAYAKHASM